MEDVLKLDHLRGTAGWEIVVEDGIRSIQSTPLVSRDGRLLGMLSNHYRVPGRPDDKELRYVDLLARQAADLIERKQAEDALAAAHRQLQSVIDNTPALVYALDLEGRFVMANASLAQLLNSTPEQIHEFISKEDADWHEANDRRVIEAGRALEFEEYSALKGRSITWLTTKFPLRDQQGRIHAVAANSIDISARKAASEALRDSEDRFRVLAEAMSQLVWSAGATGAMDYYNPQALAYIGVRMEDAAGWKWKSFVHPNDLERTLTSVRQSLAGGQASQIEHRLRRADGQYRWHLTRAVPVRGNNGEVIRWVGSATDIHDQKLAERELERRVVQRTAALAKSEYALHELSGHLLHLQEEERRRVSLGLHDGVMQLIAGINWKLELAADQMASGEHADAAPVVEESLKLAREAHRELRTFSYLLFPPSLEEAGLYNALQGFVEGFAERSGIEVELDVDPDLARMPRDTETALFRIVQESLANVHRHARSPKAEIHLSRENGSVCLEVRDFGRGLQGNLFGAAAGPSVVSGVGIQGMRERVRRLGGQMEITSANPGTLVHVTVP